nr:YqjK family protein [Rhodoferax sp.]
MDAKLVELYVQRGRLHERIVAQRAQLARELVPLHDALDKVDRARALLHLVRVWMMAHPGVVAVAGVTLAIWRPRTLLRSARWGFFAWRNWRRWRDLLHIGLSAL